MDSFPPPASASPVSSIPLSDDVEVDPPMEGDEEGDSDGNDEYLAEDDFDFDFDD